MGKHGGEPSMTLEAGMVLDGKYEIVRRIGRGGMGIVYEARHLHLGTHVAVKVIAATFDVASARERFEKEARAAAKLRSPFVVRVFDIGSTEDGHLFMVMELLHGVDLSTELRQGPPMSTAESVDRLLEISCALADAHKQGIVHRDIKASNVFLAEEGDLRVAKLLDFGIALDVSMLDPTEALLTVGTPRYMSPEQCIAPGQVSARSDVWSLGVLAYRMLARRYPFAPRRSLQPGTFEYVEPVPLEVERPDIAHELAAAVMQCLEVEPAARPENAAAFAMKIAAFGSGEVPVKRSLRVAHSSHPQSRSSDLPKDATPLAMMVAVPKLPPVEGKSLAALSASLEVRIDEMPTSEAAPVATVTREEMPISTQIESPAARDRRAARAVPTGTRVVLFAAIAAALALLVVTGRFLGVVDDSSFPSVSTSASASASTAPRTFAPDDRMHFHVEVVGRNVQLDLGRDDVTP
ncbi:MAG: serine/threonine-protein kinase [Polyangiaceae bacterium]